MGFFKRLFGGESSAPTNPNATRTIELLAQLLSTTPEALNALSVSYESFSIPKRGSGTRTILAPSKELKLIQRQLLRRVFSRLKAHETVHGFEKGRSILSNATEHAAKSLVVRLDLKDFFASTTATRVQQYFSFTGWKDGAAALLTKLCTYKGSLPQGAPTSPRLSNLVNFQMDARLSALAAKFDGVYTRYADDLTFSFPTEAMSARWVIFFTKPIAKEYGYRVHIHKKLRIYRRHNRQMVTGLVVNAVPNLPRRTRRWLRAVEHRIATGKSPTITPQQLQGWRAIQQMLAKP